MAAVAAGAACTSLGSLRTSVRPQSEESSFVALAWKQSNSRGGASIRIAPSSRSCQKLTAVAIRAQVATTVQSELDQVAQLSEIVPDTIAGDDYDRFKPTAATVTSALVLGMSSLPDVKFQGAIRSALAYGSCMIEADESKKFSCFLDKALVNVGAELVKDVSGRVSTEVDPRLAYNTAEIVDKVRNLLRMYAEVGVPQNRLLFKVPATWEGIEAARQLELDGIQIHATGVNSSAQAAACASAGVSVIQIAVGRVQDWARANKGDKDVDEAVSRGEDPGVSLVRRATDLIHQQGLKTKVMASNLRSQADVLGVLGVDFVIVPLKVLEGLRNTPAGNRIKRSIAPPADAGSAAAASDGAWSAARFSSEVGPCAKQLLAAEIEGAVAQAKKVETFLARIWPPPNV